MNSKKYFSVIIPTFNRSQIVVDSIVSVLEQSYKCYEIIIIDDASTDNTLTILKDKYFNNPKIKIISNKRNMGVSYSRNIGIQNASYDWICFLDSDDLWHMSKLEQYNNILHVKSNTIDFIHSNEIWLRNGVTVDQPSKFAKTGKNIIEKCIKQCLFSTSTLCINKRVLEEYTMYDESLPVCEDYDLFLKLLLNDHHYFFVDEALTTKRAGICEQLSYSHYNLEIYRLISLSNISQTIASSHYLYKTILIEIERKKQIVKKGALKHNNLRILNLIESL